MPSLGLIAEVKLGQVRRGRQLASWPSSSSVRWRGTALCGRGTFARCLWRTRCLVADRVSWAVSSMNSFLVLFWLRAISVCLGSIPRRSQQFWLLSTSRAGPGHGRLGWLAKSAVQSPKTYQWIVLHIASCHPKTIKWRRQSYGTKNP